MRRRLIQQTDTVLQFHERCISGSCPFCDHHHWDGKIVKQRNYSLSDLQTIYTAAPDLSRSYSAYAKLLSAILSSCQSFSKNIDAFMKTLKPNAHSVPIGVLSRIRHVMRKLYTIQFRWPMNHQHVTTYGAELAVLHRTLAAKPLAHDAPKAHAPIPLPTTYNYQKPKLTFRYVPHCWMQCRAVLMCCGISCEQVSPGSDGCQCVCERLFRISSTNPPLTCKECRRQYHRNCVADLHRPVDEPRWKCPVCAGQQGQVYPDRQLRVRWIGGMFFQVYDQTRTNLRVRRTKQ
jgi:[histone H3]-trimethyl-L-lysine4 demethylase